jgi:hypothetical protein
MMFFICSQLLDEIAQRDKDKENEQNRSDWKKTTIAPFVMIFSNFVHQLESDQAKVKQKGMWFFNSTCHCIVCM